MVLEKTLESPLDCKGIKPVSLPFLVPPRKTVFPACWYTEISLFHVEKAECSIIDAFELWC